MIGRSRIHIGKKNFCLTTTTNIYKSSVKNSGGRIGNYFRSGKLSEIYKSTITFNGCGNMFSVGDNTRIHNSNITISGNQNKVIIGNDGWINGLQLIIEDDNNTIVIGDGIFIFGNTRIYCVQGSNVNIEEGCMLSDQIEIRTTDNHSIIDKISGKRINLEEDVILHKHVWLGMHVILLKGTEIAEGSVVGAGTICTKKYNIPNSVIVGNPGKVIRDNIEWKMPRI